MSKYGSWGVHISDIPYSGNWCCKGCYYDFSPTNRFLSCIVGFSTDVPGLRSLGVVKAGGIIMECPICHEKIWFHVNNALIEGLIDSGIKFPVIDKKE